MLERNQLEIQQKLQAQMEKDGLDAMIITQPEAVFYCTGFASQFLYISNRIGMALAVVPKHGTITLLVSGFEKLPQSRLLIGLTLQWRTIRCGFISGIWTTEERRKHSRT